MSNFLKKAVFAATSIWRLHIGINSVVTLVIIFLLVYNYLLKELVAGWASAFAQWFDSTSAWHSLALGVIASIIAAFVFGVLGVFLLGWFNKAKLTGKYEAKEALPDDKWEHWGEVVIKYHPLNASTHHTSVKLRLVSGDKILEGDGLIVDNTYLLGYYTETGETDSRRSGVFMYERDGTGKIWSGEYISISPANQHPAVGRAKWEKS